MKRLSPKLVSIVKRMLPDLREEVKKDFGKWDEYIPGENYNSDKKVIELLPFAAHEYLLINRDLRADKVTIIEWLNMGLFNDTLHKVVAHTLRRLAVRK